MWWMVIALVSVGTISTTSTQLYHHDSYDGQDLDNDYYDEVPPPPPTYIPEALTRVRRYGEKDSRNFNHQDIDDIKGALKALFSGRNVDFAPKRSSNKYSTEQNRRREITRSKFFDAAMNAIDTHQIGTEPKPTRSRITNPSVNLEQNWFRDRAILRDDTTTTLERTTVTMTTKTILTTSVTTGMPTTTAVTTSTEHFPTSITTETLAKDLQTTVTTASSAKDTPTTDTSTIRQKQTTGTDMNTQTKDATETDTTHSTATDAPTTISNLTALDRNRTTLAHFPTTVTTYFSTGITTTVYKESTAQTTTVTEEPTTTTTSGPIGPKFDIEALLAIVANMTYDYDTNLTQQLNETLQRFSIPTCGFPTTTTTSTTTETTTETWYNTTLVSKCFVCGMDTPGIPRNAHCADAFATDFLPLVPIDPRAKGHISRFRKYCRYLDVNNYQRNRSDPRAFLGRWTGGCAVRWVDLSGVYTQRTCRNRLRPTTGRHYGSKRMAKLELALANVDDGCVTSPMATLVPLSRGISLYARFHACVCTGNWCNRAVVVEEWIACWWILLLVVLEVVR